MPSAIVEPLPRSTGACTAAGWCGPLSRTWPSACRPQRATRNRALPPNAPVGSLRFPRALGRVGLRRCPRQSPLRARGTQAAAREAQLAELNRNRRKCGRCRPNSGLNRPEFGRRRAKSSPNWPSPGPNLSKSAQMSSSLTHSGRCVAELVVLNPTPKLWSTPTFGRSRTKFGRVRWKLPKSRCLRISTDSSSDLECDTGASSICALHPAVTSDPTASGLGPIGAKRNSARMPPTLAMNL